MIELFFHEILHGLIALPFAIYLYKRTKSWKYFFGVILVAYFLDLDHFFDFWRHFGLNFDLIMFLRGEQFEESNQAFVYWHAWEWLIPLYLLSRHKKYKYISLVFFFGLLSHLILDSINVGSTAFYSIIYRISQGFFFYS